MAESFPLLSKRSCKHSPLLITLSVDLWIHQHWREILINVNNGSKMPIMDQRPGLFLVWLKWNQCWTQMNTACTFMSTVANHIPVQPVQEADCSKSPLFPSSYLLPHYALPAFNFAVLPAGCCNRTDGMLSFSPQGIGTPCTHLSVLAPAQK